MITSHFSLPSAVTSAAQAVLPDVFRNRITRVFETTEAPPKATATVIENTPFANVVVLALIAAELSPMRKPEAVTPLDAEVDAAPSLSLSPADDVVADADIDADASMTVSAEAVTVELAVMLAVLSSTSTAAEAVVATATMVLA